MKIRVGTLCSGYDSQCMTLDRLKENFPDFDYELVFWSEIDKYAIQAHNAVYPQWADRNLGDMTKIDWSKVEPIDLLTYSTPCQSISNAGLQHGFTEGSGTRSSIIWNVRDAVKALHPKYLMLENVKAMVEEKFLPMFNLWRTELVRLGYDNYAQVLNAKDYGIPQNRERIFLISIRHDGHPTSYHFPEPFKLDKRLKDVLELNVDEKYYLSEQTIKMFNDHQNRSEEAGNGFGWKPTNGGGIAACLRAGTDRPHFIYEQMNEEVIQVGNIVDDTDIGFKNPQRGRIYSSDGLSPCLNCCGGGGLEPKILEFKNFISLGDQNDSYNRVWKIDNYCGDLNCTKQMEILEPIDTTEPLRIPQATKQGYIEIPPGSLFDASYPNSTTRRDRVQEGGQVSPTLMAGGEAPCHYEGKESTSYRIRKLTPRECFRLMDVDEKNIDKIVASGVSNSQQYKMAGNSIVTNCMYHLFRKLFIDTQTESQQLSLF